jgi:Uma2 family endonuclease
MNQIANIAPGEPDTKRRFSVDEFMAMGAAGIFGPDERVELLAGEIYQMSPAGRFHEVLRGYLAYQWARLAPSSVLVMPEMQLRIGDDYQPVVDIGILPFAVLPPDARGPNMLLVVEIADSSLASDIGIKAAAYASGGVHEYWVINARTRTTLIHRDATAEGYRSLTEVAADQVVTPTLVPELAIRLSDLPAA